MQNASNRINNAVCFNDIYNIYFIVYTHINHFYEKKKKKTNCY